jgi:hypothetical protein
VLDELLSRVPQAHHESMCTNLRVNREILAACRELDGGERSGAEAPTSAG